MFKGGGRVQGTGQAEGRRQCRGGWRRGQRLPATAPATATEAPWAGPGCTLSMSLLRHHTPAPCPHDSLASGTHSVGLRQIPRPHIPSFPHPPTPPIPRTQGPPRTSLYRSHRNACTASRHCAGVWCVAAASWASSGAASSCRSRAMVARRAGKVRRLCGCLSSSL